jgi:ABC-2 type transport system ATP-binding protein
MNNIIEVKNLVKDYKGFKAVDDISFVVKQGEVFAFLGPNGAGKTTTIKMLTTLLRPTSGEVKINSFNPVTQQDDVRHSFGIVFQDPSLDEDLTGRENMEIHGMLYGVPDELLKQRTEELLKMVELWDKRNEQVKHYSGGMKRRLEVARGLLHHPKVLFLDEPTLGLDPQTRNLIWNYIKELNKKENVTVFFSTHYMQEAERMADKVAIIDHGKIIVIGTPKELQDQTNTTSLEDAFLALTGKSIREEQEQKWVGFRRH